MSRVVLYVACPLRPTEMEIAAIPDGWDSMADPRDPRLRFGLLRERERLALRANLERAKRWLAWLRRAFPQITFIAPWIAAIESGSDDSDPAARLAGIADCCAVIERCDGIVLCGGRVSEGMGRECDHGLEFWGVENFEVVDLTGLGAEPPHPAGDDPQPPTDDEVISVAALVRLQRIGESPARPSAVITTAGQPTIYGDTPSPPVVLSTAPVSYRGERQRLIGELIAAAKEHAAASAAADVADRGMGEAVDAWHAELEARLAEGHERLTSDVLDARAERGPSVISGKAASAVRLAQAREARADALDRLRAAAAALGPVGDSSEWVK